MEAKTIAELNSIPLEILVEVELRAQVSMVLGKLTRNGKPFLEVTLADGTASCAIKIWQDKAWFEEFKSLKMPAFCSISASWTRNQYGLDADHLFLRALSEAEIENLLRGDAKTTQLQNSCWEEIIELAGTICDLRIKLVCKHFLDTYGARFRRTAAARTFHHARRGGLVEHTAQMMKTANALCDVYPGLNRDLLLAGTLLHDCGKLWENSFPENQFTMPYTLSGELLGHIPMGIELVNRLWAEVSAMPEAADWLALEPASNLVRMHLLHMIASHHGEHQFGSPTLPKTPEAIALHYIDNLDAKLEMMRMAYESSPQIAPGIHDRTRPLNTNLISPLEKFL